MIVKVDNFIILRILELYHKFINCMRNVFRNK